MAAALTSQPFVDGLRPVNLHADLGGIADLMETCFGPTMDEAGRASIQDMRMVSNSPPLLYLYAGMDRLVGGMESGYVWIEGGKVVGNVSVSPAGYPRAMKRGFIIANVAVHPDYQRRGIAFALMQAALDLVRQKGGAFAVLQVDDTNEVARRLYVRIGFRVERAFTRWIRPAHLSAPRGSESYPFISLRRPGEWRAEMALAELVRPNLRGGLGWLRPTHPDLFRSNLWQNVKDWFTGRSEEHWIVRDEQTGQVQAAVTTTAKFLGSDRLDLMVHPSQQGQLEQALILFALRRLDARHRSVTLDHPADDEVTSQILQRYSFDKRHTLVHMYCGV